ncbi:MAG: conjugal transfer protein TraH [Nitrospinota bacterium]|nr:conjugal transfer protein TraH [Nitrospinota bacterium]
MKTKGCLIVVVLLFVAILSGTAIAGGWMDDWLTQKTSTSGGYYKGSNRGYLTGGSFNARWYSGSDSPVTVTPPKLEFGCGGINAYIGGVSFLNDPKYLQSKLESILSSSTSVAFAMALDSLCPQCEKTITKLEDMANKINGLMIDDCTASKELVAYMKDLPDSSKSHSVGELAERMTGGYNANTDQIKDGIKDNDNQPTLGDDVMSASCPQDIKDIFATQGSVLQHLADKKGLSASYVNMMRGFMGDILITTADVGGGNSVYKAIVIEGCPENKKGSVSNLLKGNAKARPADGSSCVVIPDTNKDLIAYANTVLVRAADKIENRSAQISTDVDFMGAIPLPIIPTLRMGILTQQKAAAADSLAELVAIAYAYNMMVDLTDKGQELMRLAGRIGGATGSFEPGCRLGSMEESIGKMNILFKEVAAMRVELQKEYAIAAERPKALMDLSARYMTLQKDARKDLSDVLGAGQAARVMR